MDAAEIDLAIADLDERLEKLRILYDQYFSGIERFEPMRRREELERKIKVLRRENIRNTGQRFKFQQIIQRYTTFSQYWTRILREIEKGTFKRDLARAAKRFGTTKKNVEAALQVNRTPEEEDLSAHLQDEPEELDSSFIEEHEDEDTSPFRRPDFGPPEPLVARAPAPSTPEPPSAPRSPAPVPSAPRPVSAPTSAPPTTTPAPPPSVAPAPVPAPAPAPVALAPARRPAGVRLDLEDDDDLLGGGAPVRPLPRPVASPPAARPSASVARPTSSPTPSASAPAAPAPAPVASVPAPVTSAPASVPRPAPAPRPETAERPAAARVPPPAPRPSAEALNDGRLRDIYDRYVEARRKCNESTAAITYDGLARSLRDSVPKLQQKHGGRVVDFEVVIKDGRTVLKPVVKGA